MPCGPVQNCSCWKRLVSGLPNSIGAQINWPTKFAVGALNRIPGPSLSSSMPQHRVPGKEYQYLNSQEKICSARVDMKSTWMHICIIWQCIAIFWQVYNVWSELHSKRGSADIFYKQGSSVHIFSTLQDPLTSEVLSTNFFGGSCGRGGVVAVQEMKQICIRVFCPKVFCWFIDIIWNFVTLQTVNLSCFQKSKKVIRWQKWLVSNIQPMDWLGVKAYLT